MSRGIYVALSGAVSQQGSLDNTAQNLANAQTGAFQRSRVVFRQVLAASSGKKESRFTVASETVLDREPGAQRATGRTLDIALPKDAFLAVGTPRGERYTRNGSLQMRPDGTLTTSGGAPVLGENKRPIVLDPFGGEPAITPTGNVMQQGNVLAQLRTVTFDDPGRLAHEDTTLLAPSARSGGAVTRSADLATGVLEESNSSATSAMTDIVAASRTFEAFQTAIQTFGDIDRKLVTTVPGTGNG